MKRGIRGMLYLGFFPKPFVVFEPLDGYIFGQRFDFPDGVRG